jgi:hypothetical protein
MSSWSERERSSSTEAEQRAPLHSEEEQVQVHAEGGEEEGTLSFVAGMSLALNFIMGSGFLAIPYGMVLAGVFSVRGARDVRPVFVRVSAEDGEFDASAGIVDSHRSNLLLVGDSNVPTGCHGAYGGDSIARGRVGTHAGAEIDSVCRVAPPRWRRTRRRVV